MGPPHATQASSSGSSCGGVKGRSGKHLHEFARTGAHLNRSAHTHTHTHAHSWVSTYTHTARTCTHKQGTCMLMPAPPESLPQCSPAVGLLRSGASPLRPCTQGLHCHAHDASNLPAGAHLRACAAAPPYAPYACICTAAPPYAAWAGPSLQSLRSNSQCKLSLHTCAQHGILRLVRNQCTCGRQPQVHSKVSNEEQRPNPLWGKASSTQILPGDPAKGLLPPCLPLGSGPGK